MLRFVSIFIVFLSLFAFSPRLSANTGVKLEAKIKDWSVYTTVQDSQKLCYIVSLPVAQGGAYEKRSPPHLMVTHISKVMDEVSVNAGFRYSSPAKVTIDSKKTFSLPVIEGKIAWAQDIETDRALIDGMKKGAKLTIKSKSIDNKATAVDTYSLMGFGKAYSKMAELCSSKK